MITFPILVIILTILIFVYLLKFSKERPTNFPPGPPKLPLWGSYWFMLKENFKHPHLSLEILAKKYKTDILGLYLGDAPCVVPMSYELCREALVKEEFAGRCDTIITRLRGLGGPRGIFFLDGPYWKDQRRFSLRHMRDFGFGRRSERIENFVTDEIKQIIEMLTSEPEKENLDVNPERGVAVLPDLFYAPMLNSIMLILASTHFDNTKLRSIGREALRFQRSGDPTGAAISMTPWLKHIAPDFFGYTVAKETNNYLLGFLQGVIDEHKKTFLSDYHRDFIDIFLGEMEKPENEEYFSGFTDEQLLLTVLDYMFPSAIAISHTMNFYFAYIINNPDVQTKIQEEIDRVIGRSRFPSVDDRKLMPYTEASIREGIRIMPINPLGIPRRCMEDTTLGGYFIPKDTIMLPSVWTAHKDRKIWKEPELFLPERFLNTTGQLLKKDCTLGFGAGKRLCAGETFARQNMFLIVTSLLQNFTIRSATGELVDLNNIIPGSNISIDNNRIKLVSR